MTICQHCQGEGKRTHAVYFRRHTEYYWLTCRECQGVGVAAPDAVEAADPDELEVARWESEGGR